jgi:hypothetical protein
MASGTFNALDEDFFRRGELLALEQTEDFSDLDRPAGTPRRSSTAPPQLAEGTPAPEWVLAIGTRTTAVRALPGRAAGWLWLRRKALALAAGAGLLAVIGWAMPDSSPARVTTVPRPLPPEPTDAVPGAIGTPAEITAATDLTPEPVLGTEPAASSVLAPAPAGAAVASIDTAPRVATPAKAAPAPTPAIAAAPPTARARVTLSFAKRRERSESVYARGRERYMAGDFAAAARLFYAAAKADPSYTKSYRGLGLSYRKLGDSRRAARAFRTYLRKTPRAEDAAYVRRLLAGLG